MSDKIKKSYRQSRNIYDEVLTRSTWWSRLYMDLFWGGVDDNEIARKVLAYFPDKEKAYSEVNRVLRPGGRLIGCFCIRGESRRTDWLMRRFLSPAYHLDEYHKEGSIVYFAVTKKA